MHINVTNDKYEGYINEDLNQLKLSWLGCKHFIHVNKSKPV